MITCKGHDTVVSLSASRGLIVRTEIICLYFQKVFAEGSLSKSWRNKSVVGFADLSLIHVQNSFGPSWIKLNGVCGICPAFQAPVYLQIDLILDFFKKFKWGRKKWSKNLKKRKKSRLDFDYKLLLNANIDKESIIKKTSLQTKKLFSKSGMKKYKPRVIMAQVRQEVTTKQLPMMFMKSTKKYI